MTTVSITFKIDIETLEKLNEYSKRVQKPKSDIIRIAVEELITEGIKVKPKKIWGNSIMTIVRLDKELLKRLDEFAKENKISRSFALRTAIAQYLQKNYQENNEAKGGL